VLTCCKTEVKVANGFVEGALYPSNSEAPPSELEAAGAFVRLFMHPHLRAGCPVLAGFRVVEYFLPDLDKLGWREGIDFVSTHLDCWQGLHYRRDWKPGWFFPRFPANWVEVEGYDQAFVNDALALFLGYTGPSNPDALFKDVMETGQDDLILKLLSHCEQIVLVDEDGSMIRTFLTNESYAVTVPDEDMPGGNTQS
jgi:hypothetical protein